MQFFISKLYFLNQFIWKIKLIFEKKEKKVVFAQLFFWQNNFTEQKLGKESISNVYTYYQNMLPYPLLHEPWHPTHGNSSLLNVDSMKLQFLFLVFFHWPGRFCQATLVYHILFFLKSAGIKFRLFLVWCRVGF